MPLKTKRLFPLLGLLLGSYFLLKFLVNSMVNTDVIHKNFEHFEKIEEAEDVEKYISKESYEDFMEKLSSNKHVLDNFIKILKTSKFETYFFETPGVKLSTLSRKFEFVLVDAPQLKGVQPDEDAFQEYFNCDQKTMVATFMNLGKNAVLLSPCPQYNKIKDLSIYSSLAPFVRSAPEDQVHQFFEISAKRMLEVAKFNRPEMVTWMSTSGLGIYWLHLRLDYTPKYYTYHPYKKPQ